MERKVFVIFFATFLQQVVCHKGSKTYENPKIVGKYEPDVKEIQNMTNVVLGPLLFVESYFTSESETASTCYEEINESYKELTKTLAVTLNREMAKIQNPKEEEKEKNMHNFLQTLVTTLSQLGVNVEAVVNKKDSKATVKYIDVVKEKIKKEFNDFLLAFYKVKLKESDIVKKIEEGIQNAYYDAERKSDEMVSALKKCIKE